MADHAHEHVDLQIVDGQPPALPVRPRVRPSIDVIDVGDETLTYDPERNEVTFLSGTAAMVLQLCDGTATIEQTAGELAEAYAEAVEVVEPDVRSAVEEFARQGLLEGVDGEFEGGSVPPPDIARDERQRVRMQVPRSS
jgi:Coenzyme PQQ synthesis protein D (PqqD)